MAEMILEGSLGDGRSDRAVRGPERLENEPGTDRNGFAWCRNGVWAGLLGPEWCLLGSVWSLHDAGADPESEVGDEVRRETEDGSIWAGPPPVLPRKPIGGTPGCSESRTLFTICR